MLFTEFDLDKAKEVWREEGKLESKRLIAVNLLDILDLETIAEKPGLTIEELKELKENGIKKIKSTFIRKKGCTFLMGIKLRIVFLLQSVISITFYWKWINLVIKND